MTDHERRIEDALAVSDQPPQVVVERGVNEMRVALLAILVTIALTVGFGVDASWWAQLAIGAGAFAGACAAVAASTRWKPARTRVMGFVHWLSGY
jgi:uncharacterized membrane protein YagU involved in acid resistance